MARVDIMSDEARIEKEGPEGQGREAETAGKAEEPAEAGAVPVEKMTKAQLIEEIGRIQASADENYDRYLRAEAALENLKKRFAKEKTALIKFPTNP